MHIKHGTVTSAKMQKTVVVTVDRYRVHPKYHKRYRASSTFLAHDDSGACKEGDAVSIVETRPLSKLKRWRVVTADELAALKKQQAVKAPGVRRVDEIIDVGFEQRTRAKTRGQRMSEKANEGKAPAAPVKEADAAPAPAAPAKEADAAPAPAADTAPANAKEAEKLSDTK